MVRVKVTNSGEDKAPWYWKITDRGEIVMAALRGLDTAEAADAEARREWAELQALLSR